MAYNEYSTRFFFRFESNAGREFRIDIKKRNYSGSAEQRHLGQTPVLKRENGNSGIFGTSLEIYAECRTDGEFAELYTSDAKEFLVVLSEVSGGTTTAIWHGFNTPELYAEPEVAPPYDVQIIATDGLGELKLYNFQPAGRQTLFYFIQNLLQYSGLVVSQSDVIVVDSLACVTPSVTAPNLLTGIQVDLDYLAAEGKSCYDVLSSLLTTLNLTLTRYADKWLLVRESDIEIDGGFVYGRTVSGTEVTLPVAQYGSMRNHRWYPVGRIDTDIEPAKNSLTVALPFKMRESMLNNPNLPDGTGWTYPTREQDPGGYVTWALFANDERRPYLWMVSQDVYIYQDIPVEQYAGMLTLALLTWDFTLQGYRPNQYRVHYRLKLTSGNTTYWLKVDDDSTTWETSEKTNSYKCQRAILAEHQSSDTVSVNSFDRTEIQIPGIPASGTLRVEIIGKAKLVSLYADSFAVGGVFLTQDTVPGYKDEIAINNGARGSLSEIGVDFGDAPYAPNALTNLQNILTGGASTLTSDWKTSHFTGELLSVISMDYALSVALPRLKAHGTVNVPANADLPVAFINPSDIPMLIMTSSWKILTDDLDIELISCPAAEISILSQNIREMSEEEATSVGGSTAAAGSGGGSSVVPTQPQYFVPIEEEDSDEIESIKALYDISIIQQEADEEQGVEEVIRNVTEVLRHLFLVNNNGTLYLRSDISFYSDHAVSAGGISDTGGGGGGGIDADAMWRLLADSTNEQINASHLTNALDQYASKAWVEAQGYITEASLDLLPVTTALSAHGSRLDSLEGWLQRPYLEELNSDVINTRRLIFDGNPVEYIATDDDILDLNVAIAAHGSRLDSLEGWLQRPYLEELTLSALHVERSIDLGGIVLDYDYANEAWHLRGNFYADGFVSAGGMSDTGSGSGGGINPSAMWALLEANTSEQINASHLTGALAGYATQNWVESHGYITEAAITSSAIIAALGYTPAGVDSLHPLAVSVAANSGRIASLEKWLQRPYLADLVTNALNVERSITLGGITLVYDYGASAWHLKGNFYADGFVSAGGYSGSESSGGIDAAAMWAILADSTNEQINASHLPLSVTQGDGNYVQGFTYASGVFNVVRATMPTALPDPYALSFGSKSFNGSAAVSLTASDLGAITYVRNVGPTLSRGNTHTVAVVGDTNLTVTMPNFALASEIPTIPSSLPNPYSLTIGNKSYNGSSSVTISGTDLTGAIGSNYVTNASYASSAGSAASATYDDQANRIYTNYGASLSAASNALRLLSKSGATLTTVTASDLVTVLGSTAVNRATGDKNGNDIYTSYGVSLSAASNALKLLSNSGATLSTITAANIVTVLGNTAVNRATADANGNNIASTYLPVSGGTISGDLRLQSGSYGTHLYFGDAQYCYLHENTDDHLNIYGDKGIDLLTSGSNRSINLGSSSAAAAVNIFGAATLSSSLSVSGNTSLSSTLSVSGNATFASKIYLTSNAYLEYNSSNAGIHCSKGFYSDNYMSAGGYASSSDRRLKTEIIGISEKRAWDVIGSLKPVEFRWKIGGEKSAGFVAQDVEPYLPEAVIDIGGIKRLHYDVIFSYGIAAISSLKLHTESTEQKVLRLERRVSKLEERLRIK